MPASQAGRHRVYTAIEKTYGEEVATDLLDLLPPAGLPDLATKDDLALLRSELQREFASEIGGLRGEISGFRLDIHEEISGLRLDVHERSDRSLRIIVSVIAAATATLTAVLGLLITLG